MRWEQITSEWNKDFLGCQDLSYQSEEVGFLLATGSFKNPFAWRSVKTACRTKTLSYCCIEFLFAPFLHSLLETLAGLRRVYRSNIRNNFFWGGSVLWCKMLRFCSQNTKGNGVFSVNFTIPLHREFSMSISESFYWPLFCHYGRTHLFPMLTSPLTNKAKEDDSMKETNLFISFGYSSWVFHVP